MAEPSSTLRGRHDAHRGPGPSWAITLVAEVTAEEHIETLMQGIAILSGRVSDLPSDFLVLDPEEHIRALMRVVVTLASQPNDKGVPMVRVREVQRALMKLGMAVTIA